MLSGVVYMYPVYLTGTTGVMIRADLGLGATALGLTISVFFAVGAALMPLGGRWTDRLGPGPTLRRTCLLSSVCLGLVAAVGGSWAGLLVAMAVGGVAAAVGASVGGLLLVQHVAPGRRPLAFALERSAIPASTLLAALAVPTLVTVMPWRWVFAFAAVLVLVPALVPVPSTPARPEPEGPAEGVRRAARLAPLLPLLLLTSAFTLCSVAATALSSFLVGYGEHAGMGAGAAAWLLAVGSAITIAVRLAAGLAGARPTRPGRRATAVMMGLGAVGFGLLGTGAPALVGVGVLLACGMGWGWTGVLSHAVVGAYPATPAAATGVVQAGGSTGGVIGPLLAGALIETASYEAAWLAVAVLVAASAVVVLLVRSVWDRADGGPGREVVA